MIRLSATASGTVPTSRIERECRKLAESGMDVDIPAFVKQVKALPVWKDCPVSITRAKVIVIPSAGRAGGRAHLHSQTARIRYSPTTTAVWLIETIVHELVHLALPTGEHHGERFRRTLSRAVRELWGIDIPADAAPKYENGRVRRYGLDSLIEAALEPLVLAGTAYPKKTQTGPTQAAAARVSARAALVEKRAAHAAKMLNRADRRLKLARTVRARWQKKVAYYERTAAKRGSS